MAQRCMACLHDSFSNVMLFGTLTAFSSVPAYQETNPAHNGLTPSLEPAATHGHP